MDIELFNEYKKLGRGSWGKDLTLWKTMYTTFLTPLKNEELTPLNEMLLNVFLDIHKARKEGKPIIMHPFNFEPELFFTMEIEPLMQEVISVGLSPFHLNEPFLDFVNKVGYGDNLTICNAQRPLLSLALQGGAPNPDLLFYLSTPCNSLSMSYQVFQNLTKTPSFNLDIPYWAYDQKDDYYDEKTVDYVTEQIKNSIKWMEDNTSLKFEEKNFKKTMDLCNQARSYVLEFNELLKTVPCPVTSQTGFWNFFTMVTRGGTSDAVNVTKWMRDEAAENVKSKIGGITDEKLRIAWPYTHVFFDQALLTWIEKTFNAVVIMDLLGHYKALPHPIDTMDDCYKSLSEGILDASMVGKCRGPIEYYLEYMINYTKDYKIDCVIMPMHFACKHVSIMGQVTSEAIKEEIGIPSLVFGCDSYDSREVTSEAIRTKISDFISQVVI
jgi:benzoyl-CoA reductase subunit B